MPFKNQRWAMRVSAGIVGQQIDQGGKTGGHADYSWRVNSRSSASELDLSLGNKGGNALLSIGSARACLQTLPPKFKVAL